MYLQPGEYKYITNDEVLFDNYEEIIEDDDFNDDLNMFFRFFPIFDNKILKYTDEINYIIKSYITKYFYDNITCVL
jgi:hypothetical protein